ncbi:molybdopterin-guanine dinucleotide biosynthesis protein B [Clostridium sp. Sa3CUN1]|uniref:Molybdopterin-guanine dinucleotide biosynthesis protein B n=1 Tax=Clostridium gallinarum TaxID=2762246 RepID=A0ABR8PZW3_9CLOT|nr:molybdopterin-guanine dinucleotide biosynthesis protein B [Clostridium gallinarum]MBD7913712.1 molybdopterin-guanine dinucleotide biosynthesis protein B [Clostridium gallinarum]
MSIVVNIIGEKSNVGKTIVMEGVIKELKKRGLSIATIKHDVHGFDIDKEGKDTYRHRKAGSETVIISSNERMALIKEVKEEIPLIELINLAKDKDVILVEGYKNSNLRKLEIYRKNFSEKIISSKENLIAIVSDEDLFFEDVTVIKKNNFKEIVDLILKEDEYKI